MKKIAIIPARSGSKGLPNKNILMLGNKPLIAYTIEAALKSKEFERVIVSTDSLEYKYIAEKFGAEVFMRSEELSNDKASSFVVIEDVLKKIETTIDYFVLLQVTSPFRNENHIKESIKVFENGIDTYDFLVSMQKSDKSSSLIKPIYNSGTLEEYNIDYSNYSRQKYDEYHPNGAIFIGKVKEYLEQKHFFGKRSKAYFMNKEDSVDIDDSFDFEIAITILNKKNKEENLIKAIKNRIQQKDELFDEIKDITLIGNSLFDNWKIEKLNNNSVANLGIAGISTKQYQEYILNENKIKHIANKTVIMTGTNDIVDKSLNFEDILNNINKLIESLLKINKNAKIYFIEIPSIAFRMDRNKEEIFKLNEYLKNNLEKRVKYIEVNKYMTDDFKNLKLEYTYDGLHFNEEGYKVLEKILEKEI
ncbi:N-acylneuraminate cytidylyltransferase [Fusobacterium polymorphum]|uniref:N-acylneuraminate cytidylyltransferase n=1 Tax=Fusobacterium polymorphum ATCC 10953 TaxID=393480 RepID=A5TVG7_FUSNP|nr:GDSL-type esterase/lipase family protein [Fusobacterium polymorphum]EDK88892.1 N-acylneuraminate cytidylyltransferase [Fusobacterium polymorphum ATCC 10953]UTI53397.1 GDSL-type esterase/lipase family protein [Fusobacterium polymorphum]WRL67919.1 GDSL-type esterase/lipase family protein [Fusobacterium polymorphum]CKG69746.1 N-acylneuraminate cytidylyltransferase [Fusobacterium polymorphum]